jgi:hypothetical protein
VVDRFPIWTRCRRLRAYTALGLIAALVLLAWGADSQAAQATDPIFTIAGTGTDGHVRNGGAAIDAPIHHPRSIARTADGGYVFAEPFKHTARRVRADGTITTLAGTGVAGFGGDGGPAIAAQLNLVHAVSPTRDGGFLLADMLNNRIRKVWRNGKITTVAGNGNAGYAGDGGPAIRASIYAPRGVASTPDGGFLIPDSINHRVRRVSPAGTITTVAGTGVQGFSGDGGPATAAKLSVPFGVSPTADGGFLIVDIGNQRIRRVWPDGTITTVAGTGTAGFSGDGGPATSARLYSPHNVWATADGGFLIADTANERIRRVEPGGTISTLVGSGTHAFHGDGGPANAARLAFPKAVAETPTGNLLIADAENHRIRYVGGFCRVPNLVGKTVASARASLSAAGCRFGSTGKALSRNVKKGRIVSQRPRAGSQLHGDGAVSVVVSRGRKR